MSVGREAAIRDELSANGYVLGASATWLLAELAAAREALERIQAQQPATLEKLRSNGVVFDGPLGNDPSNWQHVAFSIYTDLCEVETIARAALEPS